jgi:hypothetical protein
MPFKEVDDYRRWNRIRKRGERHPGWRQTFLDYNGMCAKCGSPENLEFHEPFGEDKGNNGGPKMQARILYCITCHGDYHRYAGDCTCNARRFPSRLQEDVAWEIERAGGLQQWIDKFGLHPGRDLVPAALMEETVGQI